VLPRLLLLRRCEADCLKKTKKQGIRAAAVIGGTCGLFAEAAAWRAVWYVSERAVISAASPGDRGPLVLAAACCLVLSCAHERAELGEMHAGDSLVLRVAI
jgi:hypothetical protein